MWEWSCRKLFCVTKTLGLPGCLSLLQCQRHCTVHKEDRHGVFCCFSQGWHRDTTLTCPIPTNNTLETIDAATVDGVSMLIIHATSQASEEVNIRWWRLQMESLTISLIIRWVPRVGMMSECFPWTPVIQ